MSDIEAGARAAFEWYHAQASRPRNWDNHPDGDQDVELGRDTFRGMVAAAFKVSDGTPLNDYTPTTLVRTVEDFPSPLPPFQPAEPPADLPPEPKDAA